MTIALKLQFLSSMTSWKMFFTELNILIVEQIQYSSNINKDNADETDPNANNIEIY